MSNYDDILQQAVATNAMLPEANADAAWVPPAIPQPAEPSVFTKDYVFAPPVAQKQVALNNNATSKMDSVAATSAAKQQAMSPQQYFNNAVGSRTGQGADSASELELDLRSLSPLQMTQKYGSQAGDLIAGQAQGERELLRADTRGQRTATELWDDFNVNFGQGVGGALGGVAALAAGVVDDDLGTGAAGLLGDFNKFMEDSQSGRLQERDKVLEAKSSLDSRDNAQAFAEQVKENAAQELLDTATVGAERAATRKSIRDGADGLTRVLSDVGDAVMNAVDDPATLGAGISSALGSFVAAGPVSKVIGAATAGKLGITTSIAATEAGGAYAQTADDIMNRSHETLLAESPVYRDLIAGGTSQEDAKQAVANQTALLSAAITAPAAAAAGRLVKNFEGNPLALGSGRQLAGNVLRETGEEAIQSGTGQFAQNVAGSQVANENQSLTEGVGRQIAEGGLYGMGMTAALGAPSVAKDGVVVAGKTLAKAFNDRVAGIEEANEQASPVSDEVVSQAAAEAQASAPEAEVVLREAVASAPAEQQAEANTYVDTLLAANNYSADEAPAQLQEFMGDVTNRVSAIQRVAEMVNLAPEGSPDQLRAGFYLNDLVQNYTAAINSDPEALTALPDDHQAKQIVGQYQGLMGAITSNAKVMTAIDTVMAHLEKAAPKAVDVTSESLATPEGQQDVQDVLATAELAPDKVDLATGEKILYQIEQGNVTVTPRQKAALDTSVALLRAVQAADQAAVASGEATKVSLNISSVDGEKGKSLTQHAKGIMSAWKSGDRELAADRLMDLKHFAQGQSNKVAAFNTHFAAGNPDAQGIHYEVFVGGEPVTSKAKVATRSKSEGGVKFAQQVAGEAKLLGDVYNGLVTAFPDLGAEHLAVTPLASELVGPAADVVARVKATKVVPAPIVKTEDTAKTLPTPKKESAPVVVETAPKPKEQALEPKVTAPVVEQAPVVESTPEPKGTAAVFSKLKGGVANLFNRSFKLPKAQKTRTLGTETPVDVVRSALKDSAAFTAFLGSSPKGEFTKEIAEAYQAYLEQAEDFVSALDDNLQAFLDENNLRDRAANGELVETFLGGKSLNIAEEVDGTLVYNPELVQGTVLAGLQWSLESPQIGGNQDAQDIAKLLGMTEDTVSNTVVEALKEGMSVAEAKRSMAQKIRNYWGVANEADGQIGYQEGIPEAMAAEMLRLFVKGGWLTETTVKLTEADGLPPLEDGKKNIKEFIRLTPAKIDKDSPLHSFPSAIEQAVLVEPEEINYVGEGNLPKVAQDQLRNPGVKNTAQQLEAIENEQKTPYFVNHVMAGFYTALGRDNVVKLFGAGELDPNVMNVNHAKSMEGVNRSTVAAFDHLQMLLGQVANTGPLDQTPIHYAFNMTRVGRLQMLGKHNPQSNKLVREAILPTYSTLDLSSETGADYKRFMLGVAQLLGVKVHKELQATGRAKAEAMLSGPLAPVVEELATWANNVKVEDVLAPGVLNDAITDMLIDGFKQAGEALTPMALHAVMEYARMKGAADKSAFRTAMYVEADGVTNGPINAMVLFTTGMFKGKWIRNIAKGGLFFNRPGETVNSHNQNDKQDLYQATTNVLDDNLNYLRKSLENDDVGTRQMNSMLHLMTEFYGGDLKYTEDENGAGTLELKRGIAKNPLTITIYGSGAGGIAAKMTKLLTDAIYERMSQVAQAQAAGEKSLAIAMFGPQSASTADAQARFARFMDAYYNLTNTQAGVKKDGSLFFKSAPSKREPAPLNPVKFTFETDQILNMQSNVKHLFVTPMRDAISETVGQELLDTAELLRQATQAQSIVLEHAFKAEVEAALAEKAKDPKWKKSDFLTRTELAAIQKKLQHLSPLVQTEGQSFYIAGSESADVQMTEFGRALNDKYQTPAFVAGPKDAGVSGIPFMNIGTGDGLMMQLISNMKNAITGTLKIFDGMNMPLDQMEQGAEQANDAVFQTWQGNPLAAIHASFDKFMSDADLGNLSPAAKLALTKALFGLGQKSAASDGDIMEAMLQVNARLLDSQQQIEARHRVMNRVSVSVDQMAAVGIPFQKNGDLPLVGTDPDAIAEQLNVYYNAELAAIRADQPTNTVGSAIESLATVHTSGARVMSAADLKNLPGTLTAEQAAVMTEVVNSLAAQDYTLVYGTPAEVAAYRNGEMPAGTAQGFTDIGSKTIYLLNPSTETLLHELVHAGTFEAVNAHYQGTSTKQVANAVGRIETLMGEFLATGQELTQTSESVNSAFNTVASVINQYQANDQPAEALNEFMAWALTNPSLVRIAQRAEVSRLAKVRNAVVSFIKSLFNIKAEVGKDLFSNLLFNSAVIMQSQPALAERFVAGMLYQNSIYGDNDRLTEINEAFNTTIGRYLQNPVKAGNIDEQSALMTGIQNGYRVAESFMSHGFKMSPQEASTFNTIVTALSTEAAIDPNAMAGVQQLYAHVMKKLSIESFMADPNSTDPNDRHYAAEKFDVLSGKYLVTKDLAGRSSLLPAFLALATTNDAFRSVLEKMDLPQSAPNKAGTLDALLENTGNMLMDKLGQRMTGTKQATNVQQAIDLLNARMAQVINQRETFLDTMASKPGGVMDRTNDIVVEGMDKLGNKALDFAKRTQRNAAGRLERAVGGVAAGFAALISDSSAGAVAEATMATINKTKMWDSVHTIINDLVGRTENNASIYDMIKAVRSVVQRTRQQYRENLPELLANKFSRELSKQEKASLHRSMAKTDLAALGKDALKLVKDPAVAIKGLEADLSKTQHWNLIQTKAKQLANYMNTGVVGRNLLRNPEAVARLFGENAKVTALADIGKLDRLITLYALDGLNQEDKDTLVSLAQSEADGMEFTLAYLQGQRAEEQRKATGRAKFNSYKGYVPSIGNEGVSMLVANDSEYAKLIGKSYERVGDYEGSSLERGLKRGYYFIPVASRGTFEQGIMQNVHQTAGGVDAATGYSKQQLAGRIVDAADVKKLSRHMVRETGPDHLMPVYSETGNVVAYERPLDPVVMERTLGEQDLHKAIGQWRGRQVEEGFSQVFNDKLIDRLHAMHQRDLSQNLDNAKQYVDVFTTTDPVLRDAVNLMSFETRAKVEALFGNEFMVRRDMLNDVLGYRAASLGDAWTGNSRWSPETQKAVRNVATSAFGNNAYKMLMTAEKTIQNIVGDAKVLIVVKSVIVPVANLMSNMFQLAARGVPVKDMAKAMPGKLAEVEAYTKSLVRRIEAEAELRAARGGVRVERRLKTEIQAINDSHKRMSIWPLIEAGEFSGIADAGMTRNEIDLTSGRLQAYMEQAAQKLPGWGSTVGRYALVTKDTALFQGLQKAVEYGDFLAKSVLFDDLTKRKGLTKAEALARITEEFVNYDRLSGRFRGAMENFGLLWFYNFKIRSVKVAASMIRNNPVHALFASLAPAPELFGTIGLPTEDNLISKLADGTLDYSMGPSMGLHSMGLNPWINLTQ